MMSKILRNLSVIILFYNLFSCTPATPTPITPSPTKPIVTFSLSTITSGIDTITDTYVVVRGFIADTGKASITDHGFIISTDTLNAIYTQASTSSSIIKKSLGALIGGGGFTAKVTGLSKGTKYSIAAYATNKAGTGYSTDSLVNKVDIKFTANSPLKIGDAYGGGIVAYLMQPGDTTYDPKVQHGLIVSNASSTSQGVWTTATNIESCGALKQGLLNGKANTDSIIKYNPSPITTAASIARSLRDGNFTDWYLPNIDELSKLHINRSIIWGGAYNNGDRYWSSSEVDATNTYKFFARQLEFDPNGSTFFALKNKEIAKIRPIRSF